MSVSVVTVAPGKSMHVMFLFQLSSFSLCIYSSGRILYVPHKWSQENFHIVRFSLAVVAVLLLPLGKGNV